MSTKIYRGVRFPKHRLAEFTRLVRLRGLEKIYKETWRRVKAIDMDAEKPKEIKAKHPDRKDWTIKTQIVMDMIKKAGQGATRTPWIDMECGWRVWLPEKGRYALAVPWGEALTEIKLPGWVEDYGYWDNTDRPDSVSAREWLRRRKNWQIACEPWPSNHPLRIVVFEVEEGPSGGIGFNWLLIRVLRRGRWGKPT